jgi:transcriptional regulator with GAF, ATPase, and Fis domain
MSSVDATLDPREPLSAETASSQPERAIALYEIGRRLLNEIDPQSVREVVRDTIVRAVNPDRACLLDLATQPPTALFAHGLDTSEAVERWPLSHTVLARVRETGLAVLATDAQEDERTRDAESVQRFAICSVVCVPIGSPVRGLLYIDRRYQRAPFTRHDLAFLTALTVYAGLALERAADAVDAKDALARTQVRAAAFEQALGGAMVGASPPFRHALSEVTQLARAGARVLLLGETGTGKELFARHYASVCGRPLVPVALPSLAPGLIESELFGHVRGAFPGAVRDKLGLLEAAQDGVLFLDEVGDLDLSLQPKLLRFLECGELRRVGDTRLRTVTPLVVAGTNRVLNQAAQDGAFRPDLLARLGQAVLIPPLRERRDDIPLLLEHFAALLPHGRAPRSFSPEALAALCHYDWPLNVRELRHVVERLSLLAPEPVIDIAHLPGYILASATASMARTPAGQPAPMSEVMEHAKRDHILRALEFTGGNKAEAIRLLRVSPDTFYRWCTDLSLR